MDLNHSVAQDVLMTKARHGFVSICYLRRVNYIQVNSRLGMSWIYIILWHKTCWLSLIFLIHRFSIHYGDIENNVIIDS